MSRLIDADALRANFPEPKDWRDPEQALMHITGIWAEIDVAPTIEPERKKGEWISKGYGEYRCSSCRNIVDLDEEILMSIKMFNYCPVCGADMMEEQP